MAAKSSGKVIFVKSCQYTQNTLWVENFDEIALSRTVKEIEVFLCFMQKFKMAAKSGRKVIFVKSR